MFATGLLAFILDVSALYVKHQFLHRHHTNALPNYQIRSLKLYPHRPLSSSSTISFRIVAYYPLIAASKDKKGPKALKCTKYFRSFNILSPPRAISLSAPQTLSQQRQSESRVAMTTRRSRSLRKLLLSEIVKPDSARALENGRPGREMASSRGR